MLTHDGNLVLHFFFVDFRNKSFSSQRFWFKELKQYIQFSVTFPIIAVKKYISKKFIFAKIFPKMIPEILFLYIKCGVYPSFFSSIVL